MTENQSNQRLRWLSWVARCIVALILLQTLFFKFTGAEESVFIFSTLGLEPWGRIGSDVVELGASVLLILPGTIAVGASLALATMVGAIGAHLTKLGIVVRDDGGTLFFLAVTVALCSVLILAIHRKQIPFLGRRR